MSGNSWVGDKCQESGCPGEDGACNAHGSCNSALGMCTCEPGWKGDDCAIPSCPGTPECSGKATFHIKIVSLSLALKLLGIKRLSITI